MSTDLRTVPGTNIKQTRFYGGDDRGVCIQVSKAADYTAQHSNFFDYIQLTRVQAGLVAEELLLFAAEQEVVEWDGNMFSYEGDEGYDKAVEYLKSIDEYDRFMANMTSIDGYSLIYTANYFWDKIES